MSDYAKLSEMGIKNPSQIRSYMVNNISGIDVLRIIYKRKEGSLLPVSRNYEFPQVQRTVTKKDGKPTVVLETAPELRDAVNELKVLMSARKDAPELTARLLDEIDALETELTCRIQHVRELLNDG